MRLNTALASISVTLLCPLGIAAAQTAEDGTLDNRQSALVPIAAFAASGNVEELEPALREGLDAGLTINEIKEALVHLYAYAGFPRSLNALSTFMGVVDDRKQRGIEDREGRTASPLPADRSSLQRGTETQTSLIGMPAAGRYIEFAPAIDQFLKAHLFGDIFGRDVLDMKTREIVTISALVNMERVDPQLRSHLKAGLNVGLTRSQIGGLIDVIGAKVGETQAGNARKLLAEVLGAESQGGTSQGIVIKRAEALPVRRGPAEWFTGTVTVDTPFQAGAPSRFQGANVSFQPGSRTAWHTHARGQLLVVTSGIGRVQRWGDPAGEIREGDVVWTPPHQKHWHGAGPDTAMSHVAILEELDGKSTEWMEKVSDQQYGQ